MLAEILPRSECRIKVVDESNKICLSVGHHDGNDYYELIPIDSDTWDKEGSYLKIKEGSL